MMKTQNAARRLLGKRALGVVGLAALLLISCYAGSKPFLAASQVSLPVSRVSFSAQPTITPLPASSVDTAEGFDAYRAALDVTRAGAIQALDSVINDPKTNEATASQARAQKMELARTMDLESTLEGILRARGFDRALVTVRQGSVNVVVGREKLTSDEAAQIMELVTRETGEDAKNVKIVPVQ